MDKINQSMDRLLRQNGIELSSAFSRYKHTETGNEALFLIKMEGMVKVRYVDSKIETWYKMDYFDRVFNPITE